MESFPFTLRRFARKSTHQGQINGRRTTEIYLIIVLGDRSIQNEAATSHWGAEAYKPSWSYRMNGGLDLGQTGCRRGEKRNSVEGQYVIPRENSVGLKNLRWSESQSVGPTEYTMACDTSLLKFERLQPLSCEVSSVNENSRRGPEVIFSSLAGLDFRQIRELQRMTSSYALGEMVGDEGKSGRPWGFFVSSACMKHHILAVLVSQPQYTVGLHKAGPRGGREKAGNKNSKWNSGFWQLRWLDNKIAEPGLLKMTGGLRLSKRKRHVTCLSSHLRIKVCRERFQMDSNERGEPRCFLLVTNGISPSQLNTQDCRRSSPVNHSSHFTQKVSFLNLFLKQ